jgi:hypothetical protein
MGFHRLRSEIRRLPRSEARHAGDMDDDRVGEDEGDEPTDSDRLRAAADQGDELARWAVTVGTNMRPGRSRRSIVGQPTWRVRRVGPVRRRLIRLTIRLEALLWAAVGRPVEVGGAITTPSRTIRWEVAVAHGWLVVRLPGLPARFSELGEIQAQGTTQVSASDRHNRLFSVLALSDGPARKPSMTGRS